MMKARFLYPLLMLCLLVSSAAFAQGTAKVDNPWRTLGMMKFERQMQESGSAQAGKFIGLIEALEGEELTLKGYIIPLSGKKAQSQFMFSAYPYNACFFCGQAGPESVVAVTTKDGNKIEFSDQPVYIKGIFEFTSRNLNEVMFSLKEAELVR